MKFEKSEIEAIITANPEFALVGNDEMLVANDGTYEQTVTKNAVGEYEWVVDELAIPESFLDIANYRDFETLDALITFLKGE